MMMAIRNYLLLHHEISNRVVQILRCITLNVRVYTVDGRYNTCRNETGMFSLRTLRALLLFVNKLLLLYVLIYRWCSTARYVSLTVDTLKFDFKLQHQYQILRSIIIYSSINCFYEMSIIFIYFLALLPCVEKRSTNVTWSGVTSYIIV